MRDDRASSSLPQSGRLQVDATSKRFGEVAALSEVSLSVAAGEFVTILGPSGSGKTTLLKVIAGFETADQGRILIDHADITELDPAERAQVVIQSEAMKNLLDEQFRLFSASAARTPLRISGSVT